MAPMLASAREKVQAARLSVLSNAVLIVVKVTVGLWIGSVAVLSEAVHSATDLVAAAVAFFAVRTSDRPPDKDHPYGHGKVEPLSGLVEGLLILAAAGYILVESVQALFYGHRAQALGWGMGAMALSALVNTAVSRHLLAVARRTDSLALEADARHLTTDIVTSVAVFAGLLLARLTGEPRFDPLLALVVGLIVAHTAWTICWTSIGLLIDGRLPDSEIGIVEEILRQDARVLSWHKLRTRKSGSHRHIDVHIQVDDDLSLRSAHALTEELEDRLREALPNVEVMIHTEPYLEELKHHEEVPH